MKSILSLASLSCDCCTLFLACFIFSTNDEILLSSQGDNIWELPGGTVENDENAIETLVREVYEETAIKICKNSVRPFSCTNVFKNKSKVPYKREFAYLARVCDTDDFINDPGGEHKYRRFVSMDEFPEVFHWGDSILPIISRLKKELKLLN